MTNVIVPAILLTPYGFQETLKSSNVEASGLVHLGWIFKVAGSITQTWDSEVRVDQELVYSTGEAESPARRMN